MDAIYNEIAASPAYSAYVQKFWTLDNHAGPFHTSSKFALPNGCCTLAFISGNGVVLSYGDGLVEMGSGIYLNGQITKRVGVSLKPHTKAIMAQVKPWLPPLLTEIPMSELVNAAISMEHFNRNLYQRLIDIDIADETVLIPEFYKCLDAYINFNTNDLFVQWAFRMLHKGVLTLDNNISDLAAASGYTQRRLEQKFKALVGPTAKEMQRILQLRQLIDELQHPVNDVNLSTLAARNGYYDQSHFIRSYQRIIAEAPSKFDRVDYLLPKTGHFDFLQS